MQVATLRKWNDPLRLLIVYSQCTHNETKDPKRKGQSREIEDMRWAEIGLEFRSSDFCSFSFSLLPLDATPSENLPKSLEQIILPISCIQRVN